MGSFYRFYCHICGKREVPINFYDDDGCAFCGNSLCACVRVQFTPRKDKLSIIGFYEKHGFFACPKCLNEFNSSYRSEMATVESVLKKIIYGN